MRDILSGEKEKNCMDRIPREKFAMPLALTVAALIWAQSGNFALGDEAQQRAEEVAQKVEKKAERTERAEGKQDLVEDKVTVKTDGKGEPVVEQLGEASYYGKGFHGKETASGESFNQNEMTAAHPTLPLGSEAKVTNLETGKEVEVEINDRGPYVKGRDLDLSKAAAKKLGMTKDGAAPVKIEATLPPEDGPRSGSTDGDEAKKEKKE
jgi:rare lipoprotein A (peptidoglycan hydrolase)